jgi:hypothetical protein
MHSLHRHTIVCIIINLFFLTLRDARRRGTPCVQDLPTLGRVASGDSFRGQPLFAALRTRAHAEASPDTSHGASFSSVPYRTVPPRTAVCQPADVGSVCQSVGRGTLHRDTLSPAGRENPGPCVSPVGRRFWDVWFPAGQIRIGSPMTAAGLSLLGRSVMPPRVYAHSTLLYLVCVSPVCCFLALLCCHAMHV